MTKGSWCMAAVKRCTWTCDWTAPGQEEVFCSILETKMCSKEKWVKVWPRQILPAWRERLIFPIYHFWEGVQPECWTQVNISSIKQWGVCPCWTVWDPPCDPDNKATAGSGAVLLTMAAMSNKNTEAFLILQRQKLNPLLRQCMSFLSRDQINMGRSKVNGLFQGVLNWAL